ncbi:hypothetical protein N7481_003225 [Penicillium waksmanii]|uniref:uncharacterized protein n=1 Tax=Penicillium waksmanii TaxID=69791 RepID=UPI0025471354|nr:uncharacterized protein N7481_003225 [Penicillium waksmanii]KAJ5988015.1 hypothetical protein N7481_003225 [Penicillium waksmanii]
MENVKRAKVACKSCHARRVKCDAATTQPCWHCQLRGTTGELIEFKRGRYARKRGSGTRVQDRVSQREKEPAQKSQHVPTPQTITGNPSDNAQSLGQTLTPPMTGSQLEDNHPEHDGLNEGPEMLYARMVDAQPSEREPNFQSDNARSFYMGESFSLSFVVNSIYNNSGHGTSVKRHYPIPTNVSEHARDAAEGLKHSDPATISYLEMRGSFSLPPQDVRNELIRVFFTSFHPAYPVLDRQAFSALYREERVSFLVLQTIFFLAFTSCSDDLVERAGYPNRLTARRTCYLRAKALYDMDYEKDKVQLTAVLFLLGFWWEGPEDQKDTWHWHGSAIGLAQTLGMHRSLVIGTLLLLLVDQRHDFHVNYTIEMSKLAVILGKVLTEQFAPRRYGIGDNRETLLQELNQFEFQLPLHLRRQPVDETMTASFWSCMLHASYHNCQILLFRPGGPQSAFLGEVESEKRAMIAADLTTRIAEDLLAAGTLSYGQLHLVPAIFAALSIHSVAIRRKDPIRRQLAENRARQCMLAMSELARSWPVAGWILRLFINLMKKLTDQNVRYDSDLDRSRQDRTGYRGDSSMDSPSAATRSGTTRTMQMGHGLGNLINQPVEADQLSARVEEWNAIQQSDQLLSDVIWAPDQNNFDFDLLFQGQSNGSLPFNFGSLAETFVPEYVDTGIQHASNRNIDHLLAESSG